MCDREIMVALWISVCISVKHYDCLFILFIISYCFFYFEEGVAVAVQEWENGD